MPISKRLAVGVAAAAVLAAAVFAQDGVPDLTGTWTGSSKGKSLSLDPLVQGGASKSTFSADFSQAGADLAVTLTSDTGPPVDLAGVVGNGTFWMVSGNPSAPTLIVGHADKTATRLQGGILSGDAAGAVDAKFKAAK